MERKTCKNFNSSKGCRYGSKCKYGHITWRKLHGYKFQGEIEIFRCNIDKEDMFHDYVYDVKISSKDGVKFDLDYQYGKRMRPNSRNNHHQPSIYLNHLSDIVSNNTRLHSMTTRLHIREAWWDIQNYICKFMMLNILREISLPNDIIGILKNILSSLYRKRRHFKTKEDY